MHYYTLFNYLKLELEPWFLERFKLGEPQNHRNIEEGLPDCNTITVYRRSFKEQLKVISLPLNPACLTLLASLGSIHPMLTLTKRGNSPNSDAEGKGYPKRF